MFSCKELPHCLCCCFVHLLLMWIYSLLISKRCAALNGIKSYHQPGFISENGWERGSEVRGETRWWVLQLSNPCYWCGSLKPDKTALGCVCLCSSIQIHTFRCVGSLLQVKRLWIISERSFLITPATALNSSLTGTVSRWNTDHKCVFWDVNTP